MPLLTSFTKDDKKRAKTCEYLKRYKKYFRDPEIREFDMQHEQWVFGGDKYAMPVLAAIDEFMETPV